MNPESLKKAIEIVRAEGKLNLKAVVAVDLFGQPANYDEIAKITHNNGMLLLEDGAQGFGGDIRGKRACSFGDISTTSFFPAKPLGCYGDGGAIFTDNDEWADLIKSLCVHGKGSDKYDNIRLGLNSRLDTIQAAILLAKFDAFKEYELEDVNNAAKRYDSLLSNIVKIPTVPEEFLSSWAQYTILLKNEDERNSLQAYLKDKGVPTMVYYPKPMHLQKAFDGYDCIKVDLSVTEDLCKRVLSLPMHPYLTEDIQKQVSDSIHEFFFNR